jgi:transposase
LTEWVPLLGVVAAEPAHLPQYVVLFAVGVAAYRGDWLRRLPVRLGAFWLGVGMTAAAMMYLLQGEPPWKCWRVLIQHGRIQHMSAPRKYDQEFRVRAVRMYRERLAEPGESKRGARRHVGVLLDLNPETLRNWAEERDRVESGRSPAPRSAESEEVRALRRRVAELERANEILKTSAAFFAQAELDRRLR